MGDPLRDGLRALQERTRALEERVEQLSRQIGALDRRLGEALSAARFLGLAVIVIYVAHQLRAWL